MKITFLKIKKIFLIQSCLLFIACFFLGATRAEAAKMNASQTAKNTSGLVGLWSFDGKDISNGTVLDRSGSGNNAKLINIAASTFYARGKIGQAGLFDGSNDYATTTPAVTSWPLSVSLWAKATNLSQINDLFDIGNTTAADKQLLNLAVLANGTVRAYASNSDSGESGSSVTTATVTAGTWFHVVAVMTSATSRTIYLNGVAATVNTTNVTQPTGINMAQIGTIIASNANARYASATIDEARLYNRALSAAEVLALYGEGSVKTNKNRALPNVLVDHNITSGLLGYFKMDTATGRLTDSSGNGNSGTDVTNTGTISSVTSNTGLGQAASFAGGGSNAGYTTYGGASGNLNVTGSGGLSVCLWVYRTVSATNQVMVQKESGSTGYILFLTATNGILNFRVRGVNVTSVTSFVNSTWTHLCGTWDGSTSRTYVNGTFTNSIANSGTLGSNTSEPMSVGGGNSDVDYTGYIDEVRVYNRALSAAEIRNDATSASGDSIYWYQGSVSEAQSPYVRAAKINASRNTRMTGGLVGLWSFDGKDMGTSTVFDRSGSGNNGTLTNVATSTFFASGKMGQAGLFDGVDDYTTSPDTSSLSQTGNITVSAWVYRNSTSTDDGVLGKWNADSSLKSYYLGLNANGAAKFCLSPDNSASTCITGSTNIPSGAWYNIIATYDGVNENMYVNGVSDATPVVYSSGIADNAAALRIGDADLGHWPFDGKIDEVRIYNQALSSTSVTALYNMGR